MSLERIKNELLGKLIRFKDSCVIYGFISNLDSDFESRESRGVPIFLEAFDRSGRYGKQYLYSFNYGLEYHNGEKWTSMPSEYYYIPISI